MTLVTISLKMTLFLLIKSILVSPGFWLAPAAITTILASQQSLYSPDLINTLEGDTARQWFKSITSPSTLSLSTSINTNSFTYVLWFKVAYAKLIPTFPHPINTTLLFIIRNR